MSGVGPPRLRRPGGGAASRACSRPAQTAARCSKRPRNPRCAGRFESAGCSRAATAGAPDCARPTAGAGAAAPAGRGDFTSAGATSLCACAPRPKPGREPASPRARWRGTRGRSTAARPPLPRPGRRRAQRAADRLERFAVLARVRIARRGDRHLEHRDRLLDHTGEQRRADQARVAVGPHQPARHRDRRGTPRCGRGGQLLPVDQRRHRAAQHQSGRALVEARVPGDAQRHVEGRGGHPVGRVGGEHDRALPARARTARSRRAGRSRRCRRAPPGWSASRVARMP